MTSATESMPAGGLEHRANTPLPPESLRQRVHGAADVESFLEVGRQCAQDMEAALKHIGMSFSAFETILDFGCGCGRVLRWFIEQHQQKHVFGTDIDRQAMAWCAANIVGGSFSVNAGLPPLVFASNSFDLIYAISVFSHLNEGTSFIGLTSCGALRNLAASFCCRSMAATIWISFRMTYLPTLRTTA